MDHRDLHAMSPAALALASLPLLTGCASLGGWIPWGTGAPQSGMPSGPVDKASLSDTEYRRLAGELAQLRDQQAHFAATLPRVQDPAIRIGHVRSINSLADRIQSLESRLRAAGRPIS
jgi:hypothetical protein